MIYKSQTRTFELEPYIIPNLLGGHSFLKFITIAKMNYSSKARSSFSKFSIMLPQDDVPDAALSLNLSLSFLLLVLEDLVLRSELSTESGDGVMEFLRREGPIFRSALVLGLESA